MLSKPVFTICIICSLIASFILSAYFGTGVATFTPDETSLTFFGAMILAGLFVVNAFVQAYCAKKQDREKGEGRDIIALVTALESLTKSAVTYMKYHREKFYPEVDPAPTGLWPAIEAANRTIEVVKENNRGSTFWEEHRQSLLHKRSIPSDQT